MKGDRNLRISLSPRQAERADNITERTGLRKNTVYCNALELGLEEMTRNLKQTKEKK